MNERRRLKRMNSLSINVNEWISNQSITHHTFNKNQYLTVVGTLFSNQASKYQEPQEVSSKSSSFFPICVLFPYLNIYWGFTTIQHCHISGNRMNDHISSLEAHCHHENWKRKPSVTTSPTPSIFSTHSVNISGFCSHAITGKRRFGWTWTQ